MHNGPHPGHSHQYTTDLMAYDGRVVQGLTDGHTVVNSHEDKDEDLQAAKEMEWKNLDYALIERDSGILQKGICNHPRGYACRKAGIRQR